MTLSFLLIVYILFLITYGAVIGFAVYKVFMFAKNKDLKGYSRKMTYVFLISVLFIFLVSILIIRSYVWNDSFGFYCKQVFPTSCICEINADAQKACQENKKIEAEKKKSTEKSNIIKQLPKI